MAKKARNGRSVAKKGGKGEVEVVNAVRRAFPEARSKRAGGESAKQDRGRDLLGTPGWCWQVKRRQKVDLRAALEEAEAAAGPCEVAVVAHRRDRELWKVTLKLDDLVDLIRRQRDTAALYAGAISQLEKQQAGEE